MPSNKKKNQKKHASFVRIIGGQWRGRKLEVIDAQGLRPSGDRIRETLFNWLMTEIHGARCLDLFAGTGALGLEALSRGAGYVEFAELNAQAASSLKANLALLACEKARVYQGDSFELLSRLNEPFDLIFIDPPFAENHWQQALQCINQQGLLKDQGLVYLEHPRGQSIGMQGWQCKKQKCSGEVSYGLYSMEHF